MSGKIRLPKALKNGGEKRNKRNIHMDIPDQLSHVPGYDKYRA
jgi:hypothetical protein